MNQTHLQSLLDKQLGKKGVHNLVVAVQSKTGAF